MDRRSDDLGKKGATKRLDITDIDNLLHLYSRWCYLSGYNVYAEKKQREVIARFLRENPIAIDTILNRE